MAETKKGTRKSTKKEEITSEVEVVNEEVVAKKERKSFRELRKLLNRDTEILIMNNTQGMFFYKCPKTHTEINMNEFGDTEIVTLEVMESMKNKGRKLLKNFCIVIVDVYPDVDIEDEIDILDVLLYLGLEDVYKPISNELENNEDIYSQDFFDNIIINKDRDSFNKLVEKFNKSLLIQLAQRSVHLFKTNKFDSKYKMDKLQEKLGIEDLFADLD